MILLAVPLEEFRHQTCIGHECCRLQCGKRSPIWGRRRETILTLVYFNLLYRRIFVQFVNALLVPGHSGRRMFVQEPASSAHLFPVFVALLIQMHSTSADHFVNIGLLQPPEVHMDAPGAIWSTRRGPNHEVGLQLVYKLHSLTPVSLTEKTPQCIIRLGGAQVACPKAGYISHALPHWLRG